MRRLFYKEPSFAACTVAVLLVNVAAIMLIIKTIIDLVNGIYPDTTQIILTVFVMLCWISSTVSYIMDIKERRQTRAQYDQLRKQTRRK